MKKFLWHRVFLFVATGVLAATQAQASTKFEMTYEEAVKWGNNPVHHDHLSDNSFSIWNSEEEQYARDQKKWAYHRAMRRSFLEADPEDAQYAHLEVYTVVAESKEVPVYDAVDITKRKVIGGYSGNSVLINMINSSHHDYYKVLYNGQVGFVNANLLEESRGELVRIQTP